MVRRGGVVWSTGGKEAGVIMDMLDWDGERLCRFDRLGRGVIVHLAGLGRGGVV